ncbi:6-bladed beta-propeller [Parasegetibacter sp. NRK P23]|nr:6-bladed beta-propeller [Parasegetibacter sp. NRK P23]
MKKIEFVPLETNSDFLISHIDKIIHKDSTFIILDKRIARSVFIFDDKGEFRKRIRTGQIDDVLYHEKRIYLLSNANGALQKFSLDGTLEKTYQFPDIFPRAIAFVSNNTIIGYNNYAGDRTGNFGRTCFYRIDSDKLIRCHTEMPYNESMIEDYVPILPSNIFTDNGSEVLVNEFANDEINVFDKPNGANVIRYKIKYQREPSGNRFSDRHFLSNGIEYLQNKKESAKADILYANKKYLFFSYINEGADDFFVLYDRAKSKVIYNTRAFVLEKASFQLPYDWFYDNNDDNTVISYLNTNRLITDSSYRNALEKISPVFSNINSLSNPILCKILLN